MRSHWLSVLFFLIALFRADFAAPLEPWDDIQAKHTWEQLPVDWESLGHPPVGSKIKNLHIALKPERESALIDAVLKVSDPSHPTYGEYLSAEQVAELDRPHPDTHELIRAWLKYHDIPSSSISAAGGSWLTVTDVLVFKANQLLGASYQLYRNVKTNETTIRTLSYALPAVLCPHILHIAPTTYFTSTRVKQQTPRKRSFGAAQAQAQGASRKLVSSRNDEEEIWPEFLKWLYDTEEYVPAATERNRLAVVGLFDEFPSQADVSRFMTYNFFPANQQAPFTVIQVNGGVNNPNLATGRATAEVEYATAMSFPTPIVFYSIGGNSEWDVDGVPEAQDAFAQWFSSMLSGPNIPQTISLALGDNEASLPTEYARALCRRFLELAARGVSVLVASGDNGVGDGDCKDAKGNVRFMADFPASCPWVTAVGGTMEYQPEKAASLSGGGFSDVFPRPRYQRDAVGEFLEFHLGDDLSEEYAGYFNASNRGYPDIAAQAYDYEFIFRGAQTQGDGTPFAVSAVAGIISLLNDYRLSEGKPQLGFLNTWLYGSGLGGLIDITLGSNPGCDTIGFPAVEGWDPATGLGTLNLQILLEKLNPDSGSDGSDSDDSGSDGGGSSDGGSSYHTGSSGSLSDPDHHPP